MAPNLHGQPLQHSLSQKLDHIVGPLSVVLTLHERDERFGADLPATNSQQHLQLRILLLQLQGSGVQACKRSVRVGYLSVQSVSRKVVRVWLLL